MLKLFCFDVSTLSEEEFIALYQNNDRQRQMKADRLQKEPDKKLSLAAGMLARVGISRHLDIPPQEISFRRSKNGKPYAVGLDIHFSISHSGTLAVCAISDKPVGIDVEQLKKVHLKVARRCFTEQEQAYVFEKKGSPQEKFFEIWTKKEAYVKMMGMGVSDFLSFDVMKNENIRTIHYEDYIISIAEQ